MTNNASVFCIALWHKYLPIVIISQLQLEIVGRKNPLTQQNRYQTHFHYQTGKRPREGQIGFTLTPAICTFTVNSWKVPINVDVNYRRNHHLFELPVIMFCVLLILVNVSTFWFAASPLRRCHTKFERQPQSSQNAFMRFIWFSILVHMTTFWM